jgi:predicted transcriptional regulator
MTGSDKSAGPPPKPTAAELDLLRLIWALGPATVKQVHEAALRDKHQITYANVLRQMQIMHTKGLLSRDERERSHVYAPAQAQDAQQASLLKDLIQKAFSGSAKDLVMAALRGHVSPKERAEIEQLLRADEKGDPS